MKLIFGLIIFLVICNSAYSKLPLCKGSDYKSYNNCYGSYIYRTEESVHTYTGEFGNTNGIKEGQGETKIYNNNNGLVFHDFGEYKNDYLNGVGTRIFYDNSNGGYTYNGEFKNGFFHGSGVKLRVGLCAYKYSGEFKEDLYHGIGTLSQDCPNGRGGTKRNYTGEFQYGLFNGQGTEILSNGIKYTGEFIDDKRHGNGELHGLNHKYIGQFKDDKYHGYGTYTWLDGTQYIGQFKKGAFEGEGELTLLEGDKYVGQFKDDDFHGYGTYTWSDGSQYIGDWKWGFQHGYGVEKYHDGSSWYVGNWKDGYPHGIGTEKLSDGTLRKGTFNEGVFQN